MELKPCPFCGSKSIIMDSIEYKTNPIISTVYFLCCQNIDCRAEGPADLGESGAIERWNTRPGEQELRADLETALRRLEVHEAGYHDVEEYYAEDSGCAEPSPTPKEMHT